MRTPAADAWPAAEPLQARPMVDGFAIALVIVAGVVSALHVGKGPIALPEMEREFGMSLASLSWLLSVFPLVGLAGGVVAGVLVQRRGDRRMLVTGLLILGLASLLGLAAPDFGWLIASRVVEGLGFLLVVVAAPSVLNRLAPPERRSIVFGVWSCFMGMGIALSMLLGPLLRHWRGLWGMAAALALLVALWVAFRVPVAAAPSATPQRRNAVRDLRRVFEARAPLWLALGFAAYNLQFFALMSFLPTFLMQRAQLSIGQAGSAAAFIVAVNMAGNLLAGVWLQRGMRPGRLMALTCALTGPLGFALFWSATPVLMLIPLCALFSAAAGVLPSTFVTCAPRAVPTPDLAPVSLGLVMQGNYLGQVLGPMVAGGLLAAGGWPAVGLQVATAALLGVVLAYCYQKYS